MYAVKTKAKGASNNSVGNINSWDLINHTTYSYYLQKNCRGT